MPRCLSLIAAVWLASACGGARITQDPLVANLSASEAQACRQAVLKELARREISTDSVRRVHFLQRYANTRGTSSRVTGYDAWVDPKQGEGTLVIRLSERCRVTDVWAPSSH